MIFIESSSLSRYSFRKRIFDQGFLGFPKPSPFLLASQIHAAQEEEARLQRRRRHLRPLRAPRAHPVELLPLRPRQVLRQGLPEGPLEGAQAPPTVFLSQLRSQHGHLARRSQLVKTKSVPYVWTH